MPPTDMSMYELYKNSNPEQYNMSITEEVNNLFDQLYAPERRCYFEENLEYFYFAVLLNSLNLSPEMADRYLHNLSSIITHGIFAGSNVNLAQLAILNGKIWQLELLLQDYDFASNDTLKNKLLESIITLVNNNITISEDIIDILQEYGVFFLLSSISSSGSSRSPRSSITSGSNTSVINSTISSGLSNNIETINTGKTSRRNTRRRRRRRSSRRKKRSKRSNRKKKKKN